jgi:hypothetical protein
MVKVAQNLVQKREQRVVRRSDMTIITDEIWNEESGKVYNENPMLSWEACEMIAWNRLTELYGNVTYENLNQQVF